MPRAFNFDWIDKQLARQEGIGGIVDLRVEACDDEAVLRVHGLEFLHLPTQDACAIAPRMIDDGVEWVGARLDAGTRVLIHCENGIGRSPLLALCILVARGIGPLDAMNRLKAGRPVVSPAAEQLEAFRAWVGRWRQRTGARIEVRQAERTFYRWATGGHTGFLASSDPRLHVGLPRAGTVDARVRWPSGTVDELRGLASGRYYRVVEGRGVQ